MLARSDLTARRARCGTESDQIILLPHVIVCYQMSEFKVKLDHLLNEYLELKSKLAAKDKEIQEHIRTKPNLLD